MHCKFSFPLLFVIIVFAACNTKETKVSKKDVLVEDMDTTTNPSTDFFQYANGGWIKNNPIPNDQSSWGIGNLVDEENNRRFKEINEKAAAANATKGSSDQKIGDFWKTAMDSAKAESLGLKPLQSWFDKINAITDLNSLLNTVAQLKIIGSSTLFSDFVNQDSKNSDIMIYTLYQGGIGLPEREYYFRKDSATANIRNEYIKYIARILTLSGEDSSQSKTDANDIMALETKLATASRTINQLRDDYKNYNKVAIADLPKLSSSIDWASYLGTIGVKSIDSVIVGQPEFFKALNNVLKSTPISIWKS